MSSLLKLAIEAHDGVDRRNYLKSLKADLSFKGDCVGVLKDSKKSRPTKPILRWITSVRKLLV